MNFGNMSHGEAMHSLRLFGQEVLPAFRRSSLPPSIEP